MFILIIFYMFLMFIYLFIMFMYFKVNQNVFYLEFELINILSMKMELLILMDWITLLFLSVVIMISFLVIIYSFEYMNNDINIQRFLLLIMLFVFSMILMVISPNLISILLGWDGLGLVSYCLVIYYQSYSSYNSGMVTVLTNRFGDILILMSIGLMIEIGSWNFMFLNEMNPLIMMILIFASITKSAQIPFSSWLPMAMAAPTPISSLVHSSTLVTAGVYLLIRLNYLMLNYNILNYIMLMSVITMFLSGLGANLENDFKKIIALSTLSQLGLMIFCLSMKLMEISLFHLLIHAMFKSMLFMCVGVIIHNMSGNQDIRYISMTFLNFPIISILFNCSIMSLCGIPFMSGFFSKDLILEMYLMSIFNKMIFILLFFSMGLTIMYSFRLMMFSFIKIPQLLLYNKYNSLNSLMGISMILLFIFSIIKGLILSWILFSMKNKIFLTISFKLMIYLFMFMGIMFGLMFPKMFFKLYMYMYMNNYKKFILMLWFMPLMYMYWIPIVYKYSNLLMFKLDLGWIEYLFGNKFIKMINLYSFKLEFFKKNYYYLMIFFMMVVMVFMF